MRFTDYIALVRSRLLLVVGTVVLVTAAAFGLSRLQAPSYTAAVRIHVLPAAPGSPANSVLQNTTAGEADLGTESQLVTSAPVINAAKQSLGLDDTYSSIIARLSVTPLTGTSILTVQAIGPTPTQATALVNAVANAYLDVRRTEARTGLTSATQFAASQLQQAQDQVNTLEAEEASLPPNSAQAIEVKGEADNALAQVVAVHDELQTLANSAAVNTGFGQVIDQPLATQVTATHASFRTGIYGVMIGLPLALAFVLILDAIGDRLRNEEDAARQTESDVLALIPDYPHGHDEPAILSDPFSAASEGYRSLAVNLTRVADAAGARTILVTSPGPGEGKTTLAANLALALAEAGRGAIAVEADLRNPALADLLGGDEQPGLTEILRGAQVAPPFVQRLQPALSLIAAGSPSERPDLELINTDLDALLDGIAEAAQPQTQPTAAARRTRRAVQVGRGGPAPVLLDSAAVLQAGETSHLARSVDGVVLVVRVGTTRRRAAAKAAEQVRRAGGVVLGTVLIGVNASSELGVTVSDTPPPASLLALSESSRTARAN